MALMLVLAPQGATAQDTITFTSFGGAMQEAQRKALLDPTDGGARHHDPARTR